MANDLSRIIAEIAERPREAKPITDIPLGPKAPAKAKNVEIVSRPQVKPAWRKHRKPVIEVVEPIPKAEPAKAKLQGRSQEDYYRAVREATRRAVGRKVAAENETSQALVRGLRRKDRRCTGAG